MLVYILFAFIVSVLIWRQNRITWYPINKAAIGVLLIIVFSAFRFDIGYDYGLYYAGIMNYGFNDVVIIHSWEPGHLIFLKICEFFNSPVLYFVQISIFTLSIIFYAIYKYNASSWYIGVAVYMGLYFCNDLSVMRQAFAVSIYLFSYQYMRDQRLLPFCICSIIAFFFHFASIAAFPIYFLFTYVKKNNLFYLIPLGFIAYCLKFYLHNTIYGHYIDEFDSGGGDLTKYAYLIIVLLFALLYAKVKTKDVVVFKLVVICLIGCIFPFVLGGHLGARVQEFYLCFMCILVPKIVSFYNIELRKFVFVMFIVLFIAQVYNSHSNASSIGKDSFVPYQTIFQVDLKNPKLR